MARVLVVQHDYPPVALGGYGVMCAQVCEWLAERGHDLLVLTAEAPTTTFGGDAERPARVAVRRELATYWDSAAQACVLPPFADALAIEHANHERLRAALVDHRPEVVAFWHMGAMSLGLITATARRGLPIVFVVGDDWLCYGGWADGWLRRFADDPDPTAPSWSNGRPACPPACQTSATSAASASSATCCAVAPSRSAAGASGAG